MSALRIMSSSFVIDFNNLSGEQAPEIDFFVQCAKQALMHEKLKQAELSISLVIEAKIAALNKQYRQQDKPTNVLSFESQLPPEVQEELNHLGDIIICTQVVKKEAKAQNKEESAHFAHMVIHGVLHLLGYDHIKDEEAETMEAKEVEILKTLGFPNPY